MRINPITSKVVNLQPVKDLKNTTKLQYASDVVNISKNTIGIERKGKIQ